MNTEFRNKILNRYIEHAENENTQEQQSFLQAREKVDQLYPQAFRLAKDVVENAYPQEDVDTCKSLKKKYGQPLDVVAKDKCFYFSYANEDYDENDDQVYEDKDVSNKEISEHFDFGLYGYCDNGDTYNNDSGKKFA